MSEVLKAMNELIRRAAGRGAGVAARADAAAGPPNVVINSALRQAAGFGQTAPEASPKNQRPAGPGNAGSGMGSAIQQPVESFGQAMNRLIRAGARHRQDIQIDVIVQGDANGTIAG